MRIRRDISAIPVRTGSDTWKQIVSLIVADGSRDVSALNAATAIMASVISDESPATLPFKLEGCGPQLRVYCLYGSKAISAGTDVDKLTWNPTDGDWTMHVPSDADNKSWVAGALAKISGRFKVYDVDDPDADETDQKTASALGDALVVDWNMKD